TREIDRVTDIGLVGQRVAATGDDLLAQGVRGEVVDASGLIVTPGWVDLHTHVYWGVAPLGVVADAHCLQRGVTTAVDAGSAGASTFAGFKRYVIDVSATRVVAMLHLSAIGMMRDDTMGEAAIGELEDIRWANVDRALEVARAFADVITGIKIRISEQHVGRDAEHTREVLRRARQVADAIGKPVMVHSGSTGGRPKRVPPSCSPPAPPPPPPTKSPAPPSTVTSCPPSTPPEPKAYSKPTARSADQSEPQASAACTSTWDTARGVSPGPWR